MTHRASSKQHAGGPFYFLYLLLHKSHKADSFERVATIEGVEDGREFFILRCGERFVNFIEHVERYEMREVGAH